MRRIDKSEFEQFFFDLHGHSPFPWQTRLAHRVCEGSWPKVIDLPTASGKTACIDIALFALAVRGKNAPRRIFFVVDRRVIVNEAFVRAQRISEKLKRANSGILGRVAESLRELSGDEPLKTYELRGGAFRDETWVRTPRQPVIVTSTVDQVGSRLLFRGYGIGENTWPIHAGLIANDAILFLDEAHCSKAFSETLEAVEQYRGTAWASGPVRPPFHFVEMTATPGRSVSPEERFGIDDKDRSDRVFKQRLYTSKPVRLAEPIKCRKDETGKFADALIAEATRLQRETNAKRIAILVNRIATAKAICDRLKKAEQRTFLVIGRMRPLDRDKQATEWQHLKAGSERSDEDVLEYVVSTQCLEVGADLDFDALVSECASIDALQQRFGRLDRTGAFGQARGAILAGTWQLGAKEGDPVYGEALKKTWEFLQEIATDGSINMGIEARPGEPKTVAEHLREQNEEKRAFLLLTAESAPKLLPSHLDALVQSNPRPTPEPAVEYFLHGPKQGNPDVYVVWRRDLTAGLEDSWRDVVAICPPSSLEAMPVPLWTFRKWFAGEALKDESDVEVVSREEGVEDKAGRTERVALIWRDKNARIVKKNEEFRPGDTIVLPESAKGWNDLGSIPRGGAIDLGDQARLKLRRRITLRLHPEVLEEWWPDEAKPRIREALNRLKEQADESALMDALAECRPGQAPLQFEDPGVMSWNDFVARATLVGYPNEDGWALEAFYGRKKRKKESQVLLRAHLDDVVAAVDVIAGDLIPDEVKGALRIAAEYHDYGKVDVRYQSWLRNGDGRAAAFAPKPLAKSGETVWKKQAECGLPESFRHELLSLKFAEKTDDKTLVLRDLVLHLIASHHGYCRPFAPVVIDREAECVSFGDVKLCRKERLEELPHALGSGLADRFWRLSREYGWWGLAYLEGILRLADWYASDKEQAEVTE